MPDASFQFPSSGDRELPLKAGCPHPAQFRGFKRSSQWAVASSQSFARLHAPGEPPVELKLEPRQGAEASEAATPAGVTRGCCAPRANRFNASGVAPGGSDRGSRADRAHQEPTLLWNGVATSPSPHSAKSQSLLVRDPAERRLALRCRSFSMESAGSGKEVAKVTFPKGSGWGKKLVHPHGVEP